MQVPELASIQTFEEVDAALKSHASAVFSSLEKTDQPKDGNCLFHAIADQCSGHDHQSLRALAVRAASAAAQDHLPYFDNSKKCLAKWLAAMRKLGTYGDQTAIVALSDALCRPFLIWRAANPDQPATPIPPRRWQECTINRPIYLLLDESSAEPHYWSMAPAPYSPQTPLQKNCPIASATPEKVPPSRKRLRTKTTSLVHGKQPKTGAAAEVAAPVTGAAAAVKGQTGPKEKPSHNLILTASFFKGLAEGYPSPEEDSTFGSVSNIDKLPRQVLTSLMFGDVPKVQKCFRSTVRKFANLSFSEKENALKLAGVYVYDSGKKASDPPRGDQGQSDVSDDDLPVLAYMERRKRQHTFLLPGQAAVVPHLASACLDGSSKSLRSSRLSRALKCNVWSVDWEDKLSKPAVLNLWRESDLEARPLKLSLLFVRETGQTYYAQQDLMQSEEAAAVLESASSFQEASSRMPLLSTPTTLVAQTSEWDVLLVDDEFNESRVCVTDGQSEIGLPLAKHMGILGTSNRDSQSFVVVVQFRGLVRVSQPHNDVVLVKGLLVVNDSMGMQLKLRASCCKLQMPHKSCMNLGLDVVKTSTNTLKAPDLGPQLVTTLRMRCLQLADSEQRLVQLKLLEEILEKKCAAARVDLASKAWGLKASTEGVAHMDEWSHKRVPQHVIAVNVVAEALSDDEAAWSETAVEREPWRIDRGTKQSLQRGSSRYVAMHKKLRCAPRCCLENSASGYAVSDPWCTLPPHKCHVIISGKVRLGKVVVWRSPTVLPQDIQIWEAVPLPASARAAPDNAVVCSRQGNGVADCSGGDYDGDILSVSQDPQLLALAEATSKDTFAVDVQSLSSKVQSWLDTRKSEVLPLVPTEFSKLSSVTPTPRLRASSTVLAERFQQRAFLSTDCDLDGSFETAIEAGLLTHRAYDAPKKYTGRTIKLYMKRLVRKSGLSRLDRRSTTVVKDSMRKSLPALDYKKPSWIGTQLCDYVVDRHVGLGMVWMPGVNLNFGWKAGAAIRRVCLSTSLNAPAYAKSCTRSPIIELSHFLLHRFKLRMRAFKHMLLRGDPDELALSFGRRRYCAKMKSLVTLRDGGTL
jgi:hypothetical protein